MIGVFDSGLGGLSVLSAVAAALPDADFCYFADTAFVPYGNKSDATIRARVLAIGDHLVALHCRLIVVACNTATVSAVHALRERHPQTPVVGIEPGIKPAVAATRTGKIAVLVTESTARSERLASLIRQHATDVEVHIEACPGWATQVEQLRFGDAAFRHDAEHRLNPLIEAGCDQIVLGCTHYSFLRPILDPIVGGRAALVDVADAVARQTVRLYPPVTGQGAIKLLASTRPDRLLAALPSLGLASLADHVSKVGLAAV